VKTDTMFTRPIRTEGTTRKIALRTWTLASVYSVHTNLDSLRIGESNIADIGRRLHNQGVLGRARR
jgi:putative NIF3 family GTP cyclohydrolase 1 type 2